MSAPLIAVWDKGMSGQFFFGNSTIAKESG